MILPRFIKSAYRKEPISSFMVIMGGVDAVIGGVGNSGTLFAFGIMMVIIAIALRWIQAQRSSEPTWEEAPVRYLPSAQTQQPVPRLRSDKRHSSY